MEKWIRIACLSASLLMSTPVHATGQTLRDLRLASGVTSAEIDSMLVGTGLAGLGPAFAAAERDHGVNALALLSIAILESGWGRSRLAQKRNNLFGMRRRQFLSFHSKESSVDHAGNLLKSFYFPRGRTNLRDVGRMYAADPHWATKVARIWTQLEAKLETLRSAPAAQRRGT